MSDLPKRRLWHGVLDALYHFRKPTPAEEISQHSGLEPNLVSSLTETGLHAPALDLDFPVRLVPSRTKGHYHLYIDREMTWKKYKKLLTALYDVDLIESGFYEAAMDLKMTMLRIPRYTEEGELFFRD